MPVHFSAGLQDGYIDLPQCKPMSDVIAIVLFALSDASGGCLAQPHPAFVFQTLCSMSLAKALKLPHMSFKQTQA